MDFDLQLEQWVALANCIDTLFHCGFALSLCSVVWWDS